MTTPKIDKDKVRETIRLRVIWLIAKHTAPSHDAKQQRYFDAVEGLNEDEKALMDRVLEGKEVL